MPNRTPEQIQKFLDGNMYRMDLPAQYFGEEPNATRKPWESTTTRWCIVASWPYEAAAGNQSIPAVYKSINIARDDFLCDRFYLPATPRDLRLFEKNGYPIFGIESKHQLMDFDVVATSIAYPILIMSFHKMLNMSDIPARRSERVAQGRENFPMVLVGGQAYGAPEPLSPIIDCFFLGECEDEPGNPGIGAVTARIAQFKAENRWQTERTECYKDLAREFNFLYFPEFIDVQYHYEDRSIVGLDQPSKQVCSYTSNLPGMRLPLVKRIVKDMDKVVPLDDPPLLMADPGMGAGDLEVGRGCSAWCSFCALTYRQKPMRQRSVEYMVDFAKSYARNMGSTRLAPFMPDFPLHKQRKKLISALLENVSDEVDAPAMRIDDFISDPDFIMLQVHGGMDKVTLGVEGNSQRMRDLVAKGTSDQDIMEVVSRGIRAGIRKFKFFMISNLPGEDEGDVFRILSLAKKLADIRDNMNQQNVRLQFSWTPLLIEAGTPFQWFAPPANTRALGDVWEEFRDIKVDFKLGGKFIFVDELILTPNRGLVRYGDLQIGDSLVDPDGYSSKVIGIADPEVQECFRVTWSDGTHADAAAGHWWDIVVDSFVAGQRGWHPKKVTTLQLKELLERKSYGKPRLPSSAGLCNTDLGPDETLPIDPYILGLLLGDGCFTDKSVKKHGVKFGSNDPELIDNLELSLPSDVEIGYKDKSQGGEFEVVTLRRKNNRGHNSILLGLRSVGLCGCDKESKFVPECYKFTTAKARLALLQGLMDTDGGRTHRGAYYSSKSKRLRDDVTWLARSLGLQVHDEEYPAGYKNEDGVFVDCGTVYRCEMWQEYGVRVFRLGRKFFDDDYAPGRKLVSVESIGEFEGRCIEVSAPSARYLVGDGLVVTSNAEPNKATFFQLCQRSSREIGECIVDAMDEIGTACWGGVPKHMKDLLDSKLREHGFNNGLEDAFDERFHNDMFGWEFINQGMSTDLLWNTYLQSREFLEQTDSHTYDLNFDDRYHGNEWVEKCDSACQGKLCGVCDPLDLKIRQRYIEGAKEERDIDLSTIKPVDQRSQAFKVRARIYKPEKYRFVMNDHWRFNVRRAAYRAQDRLGWDFGITKRSIRFASDEIKYKDWTCGIDYLEFGITRRTTKDKVQQFINAMNEELCGTPGDEDTRWIEIRDWSMHPGTSSNMRTDIDLSLFELELDSDPQVVVQKLKEWESTDYVKMILKQDAGYFAPGSEEVNAKEFVDDLWLARDGHRLKLRMLLRGRPSPYNVYASLMGRSSWLAAAQKPAVRLDAFVPYDAEQSDFFRPNCEECGMQIPTNVLDEPYNYQHCPRCKDEVEGILVKEIVFS